LKKGEYEVFAREVQVVDNIKQSWFRTARDRDKDKKGKNQIELLVDQQKDAIEFVEPQSMNFDIKLSDAYKDFLASKSKESKDKVLAELQRNRNQEIIYENGEKFDYVDMFEDEMFYLPKATKKVRKKLKDNKFMTKLRKHCEEYVMDNPEKFQSAGDGKPKAKFDIVDNKVIDLEGKKQKKNKEGLDEVQIAEVQNLVIKRFKRVKKDIVVEDDEKAML